MRDLFLKLTPANQAKIREDLKSPATTEEDNTTTNEFLLGPSFYTTPLINKEAILADNIVRSLCGSLEKACTDININVNRSDELATVWQKQLNDFDTFITSTKTTSVWIKWALWSTATILIGSFLWKMGA